MRTLAVLLTLGAALALGAPAAAASTATGSGDGVTVTVSLSDTATAGAPFTVAESIANTTATRKLVRVTQTLEGPSGKVFSFSYPLVLPAARTLSFSLTFRFPHVPPGTYALTLSAGAASATATTVVGPQ